MNLPDYFLIGLCKNKIRLNKNFEMENDNNVKPLEYHLKSNDGSIMCLSSRLNLVSKVTLNNSTLNKRTFIIKVCPYTENDIYMDYINNEIEWNNYLTKEILHENISPHIVKFFSRQRCSNLPYLYNNNCFKNWFKKLQIFPIENVKTNTLILEYLPGGSLYDKMDTLTVDEVDGIAFQTIYTLYQIRKRIPNFNHCNLNPRDIMLDVENETDISQNKIYLYHIEGKLYAVPVMKYLIKLGDFKFCSDEYMDDKNSDIYQLKHLTYGMKISDKLRKLLNEIGKDYFSVEDIVDSYFFDTFQVNLGNIDNESIIETYGLY